MNPKVVAAVVLSIGWTIVTLVLVVVEPRMGFAGPADYLDSERVAVGIGSLAWFVGDLTYFGFFFALGFLALRSDDSIQRVSGLGAAVLFLVIASIGRVLAFVSDLESTLGDVSLLVSSLLPIRLAVLRAMAVLLGIFAWRTTLPGESQRPTSRLTRGFGLLILLASVAFFFVFLPIPILFTVWAVWLTIRFRRDAQMAFAVGVGSG